MPLRPRAPPRRVHVLEDHPDDFAESQGDEGEVVALQAERGYPDDEPGQRGAQAAGDKRGEEKEALLERGAAGVAEEPWPGKERDGGGEVGSDRHEAGMAERELARVAVHEVERDGEDDVDADAGQDIQVVGVDVVREIRDPEGHQDRGEQGDERLRHRRLASDLLGRVPAEEAGRAEKQDPDQDGERDRVLVGGPSRAVDECLDHAEDERAQRGPGMLPTPPSTAATKALRPGTTPIRGSIEG